MSLYVTCWIRSTFDAFDEACTLHTGVDAPEVVSVQLNKSALLDGEYTDPTWYVNSLVYEYCQFQIDEASTQVATTLYEMMSVREVAVAVPAGSQFPLTDHESRPIDFGACELTPMEQIMVAELQADAARYVSIDTNGNGACGLHAPFGVLVTAACCERSPEIQTFNVTKFVSVHKCTPRDLGRTGSAYGIASRVVSGSSWHRHCGQPPLIRCRNKSRQTSRWTKLGEDCMGGIYRGGWIYHSPAF